MDARLENPTPAFELPRKQMRGFAAMPRELQREIASKGGRAAHMSGHAHEFTPDEARAAGRKRHEIARRRAQPPSAA